ncbi:DUF3014 domain-containing protein [Congregibacter variabilis]|uniref:DUF3014 domain-containing protein n=1 Tax=Congregibacter variabilis TaxID=3081200 RepID=A0ABZ0I753_9GAMM|nr:DUF3014 domain-containing protein [Congregibacter sp. IMCC43200]
MQADRDDRFSKEEHGRHSTQTLVTAVAVLILAGGAYLLMPRDKDSGDESPPTTESATTLQVMPEAPKPTPDDAILAAPDIPVVVETEQEDTEDAGLEEAIVQEVVVAPPTPEEIDQQLRDAVREVGLSPEDTLGSAYNAAYLLDRGVSSIDQLARGLVPTRTTNIAKPPGKFKTTQEGAEYWVSRESYERYDNLVASITALPAETLATLFHQQRSLLQDAYAALGYPSDAMDNTLIAALDNILSAPTREQPPALVSKGAMWAYADPELEGASDLHKQLLRTGPQNTEALQTWARQLKSALLNP